MFKLVKILNSGTNVAEPQYVPTDPDNDYYAGSVIKISGGVATNVNPTDIPTHVVCETVEVGTKKRLLCYKIDPNMVFEAAFSASPVGLKVGDKVTLALTPTLAQGITANTTSGVAEIIDLAGAKNTGDTAYVIFPG